MISLLPKELAFSAVFPCSAAARPLQSASPSSSASPRFHRAVPCAPVLGSKRAALGACLHVEDGPDDTDQARLHVVEGFHKEMQRDCVRAKPAKRE